MYISKYSTFVLQNTVHTYPHYIPGGKLAVCRCFTEGTVYYTLCIVLYDNCTAIGS